MKPRVSRVERLAPGSHRTKLRSCHLSYIGIMEKKMETIGTIGIYVGLYGGYIGTMEKKMKTTIMGLYRIWGLIGDILG